MATVVASDFRGPTGRRLLTKRRGIGLLDDPPGGGCFHSDEIAPPPLLKGDKETRRQEEGTVGIRALGGGAKKAVSVAPQN